MADIKKLIKNLEGLNTARTQGEWEYDSDNYNSAYLQTVGADGIVIGKVTDCAEYAYGFKDLKFICAIANATPTLIAHIKEQAEEIERLIEALRPFGDAYKWSRRERGHPSEVISDGDCKAAHALLTELQPKTGDKSDG